VHRPSLCSALTLPAWTVSGYVESRRTFAPGLLLQLVFALSAFLVLAVLSFLSCLWKVRASISLLVQLSGEYFSFPNHHCLSGVNMLGLFLTTTDSSYYVQPSRLRRHVTTQSGNVKNTGRWSWVILCSVAIGNPERQVRKASHCGSNQQSRSCAAITLFLLVRATYKYGFCSSRTSRSWWTTDSTQRQPRGCSSSTVRMHRLWYFRAFEERTSFLCNIAYVALRLFLEKSWVWQRQWLHRIDLSVTQVNCTAQKAQISAYDVAIHMLMRINSDTICYWTVIEVDLTKSNYSLELSLSSMFRKFNNFNSNLI